jgi:hypothetical protein
MTKTLFIPKNYGIKMSSIATAIVMLLSALPVIVEDTDNTLLLKRLIRLKKQPVMLRKSKRLK